MSQRTSRILLVIVSIFNLVTTIGEYQLGRYLAAILDSFCCGVGVGCFIFSFIAESYNDQKSGSVQSSEEQERPSST